MATQNLPPPPSGEVLALVSALSQTENHDLHVQAIRHRDEALSASQETYGNLCFQLCCLLVGSDQPEQMQQRIDPSQVEIWRQTDMQTVLRLQSDPNLWVPFGQMAGLILKNALLRPPLLADGRSVSLESGIAQMVKETLLFGLGLNHNALRNVVSTIIATSSVSADSMQPYLHIGQWPQLMTVIIQNLQPSVANPHALQGSLSAIQKMMEDGPNEIPTQHLDAIIPLLLHLFRSPEATCRIAALQSLVACLASGVLPSALVVHFSDYLQGLSALANDSNMEVRKWVCRSINTLLEHHTQYLAPQLPSICQFMMQSTVKQSPQDDDTVAMEACEFWLLFASLDEHVMTSEMFETVERMLPQLIPVLLNNMVYSEEQRLSNSDPWIQEASILALGAIAEGCREEMDEHMGDLYPYLLNLLATPETPQALPQVKCICAWTIGRYAAWAVEQVQSGAQGHLVARTTEIFLQRLQDRNKTVQVACGSALGVMMETAGDLMAPYLEHVYRALVSAMSRYHGRSLIIVFDTLGIMADFCGPVIGEHDLPKIYVPAMLEMFNVISRHDPTDRMLLPLMESMASVALTCGVNYQPYALDTFEAAMAIIEQLQLVLATSDSISEEDADPIVCALDLLDGLCEGMGPNFAALVASSNRYAQHFTTVLHAQCRHQVAGVRMSGLALLGDLARNAPSLLEPALPQLLQEAIGNLEPSSTSMDSSLCNNAVWAIGEICVQCGQNAAPLQPFAPVLMQHLIALLMGNGMGRVTSVPGLAENSAACVGRLAIVNANFVAPELPRFLMGWCDGMARIDDPTERRDAFTGFCKAVYANPQSLQQAAPNVADVITSILFAIISWHVPPETPASEAHTFLSGEFGFHPFPPTEPELGGQLVQLLRDIRTSVGEEVWKRVENQLPVNVRTLLRNSYQM
eukprot:Nitzschia sp. Nitz4//scaffold234_size30613//10903//13923//NITZ4_007962-RA/size30613-snap-gene-0.2-mRNA-1//1//CDS//3329543413//3515//frame0